jgi:HSP20 family protein
MDSVFVRPVFEMSLSAEAGDTATARARESDGRAPVEWYATEEGQLAIDVADTGDDLLVVSTVAGAVPEQIQVYIHHDLLTIRGKRISPVADSAEYLYRECFWGGFSRSIVLPVDVKGDLASASYRNGVLSVRIPKRRRDAVIPVHIVDE